MSMYRGDAATGSGNSPFETANLSSAQAHTAGFFEGDSMILVLVAVLVIGSLWYGQNSRAMPAGCRTDPTSMQFVPELDVAMSVKNGTACAIWSRVSNTFVDSLDIEVAPRHGTLRTRGLSGVIYRPEPGYSGGDAFVFVRRELAQPRGRQSRVRVQVSVE